MYSSDRTDRDIWSTADLAAYLDVSERTIRRWRKAGALPFVVMPGGFVRYSSKSVKATIAKWERR